MNKMTITEALAEIKLILSKIAKKHQFVLDNLTRYKHVPDANITKGGTAAVLAAEVQSISDLENRLSAIRSAIMKANLENTAECNGQTKSIYEWLTWKREVARNRAQFYESIYVQTKRKLDQIQSQPQVYKTDSGQPIIAELEANLPYMDYAIKQAEVSDLLGKLDGILSLKNATITIEV